MAHVSRMAHGIHYCVVVSDQPLYIMNDMLICTHISDTVQTVREFPFLPNNTAVKHFHTNR